MTSAPTVTILFNTRHSIEINALGDENKVKTLIENSALKFKAKKWKIREFRNFEPFSMSDKFDWEQILYFAEISHKIQHPTKRVKNLLMAQNLYPGVSDPLKIAVAIIALECPPEYVMPLQFLLRMQKIH